MHVMVNLFDPHMAVGASFGPICAAASMLRMISMDSCRIASFHGSKRPPPPHQHFRAHVSHLGIRNPLTLFGISHIGGGEHPPKKDFRKTPCEACGRRHGRAAKGQEQHL